MKKQTFDPQSLIPEFDDFLYRKGVNFQAIVIGSGAMSVMGLVKRHTIDIDVLKPKIPDQILKLAQEFRLKKNSIGVYLIEEWINNGPDKLLLNLPKDFSTRTQPLFKGKALNLFTLGRPDLLKDKLWGFCDLREQDKEIIYRLKPTKKELLLAAGWVKKQEAHPYWPTHVHSKVQELLKGLGYE